MTIIAFIIGALGMGFAGHYMGSHQTIETAWNNLQKTIRELRGLDN